MMSEKKHIENKIIEYLNKREEILFAYIFGSFISKDHYHDIDIAVYLTENFDKNDTKKFPYGYESYMIPELNLLTRKNIDFIVMNSADIVIQKKIITQGKLLFCKDERKRIYYENYIRKIYIDTEELRKIKRHYLSNKITNA